MTPKKQVSPVIRISQGERDASARATHLEAATRKFLVTTNERKQMSTTTNFKRIALVAVAALGMGVLSSVPVNAAIGTSIAVTPVAGTATTATSDSSTAATVRVVYLKSAAALAIGDSVTVQAILKTAPTSSTLINDDIRTILLDTGTSGLTSNVDTDLVGGLSRPGGLAANAPAATSNGQPLAVAADTFGAARTFIQFAVDTTAATTVYSSANYGVFLDTSARILAIGTYTLSLIATPFVGGVIDSANQRVTDMTIVVTAGAPQALAAVATGSTAVLQTGSSFTTDSTQDSTTVALGTASTTAVAVIRVILKNAAGTTGARESVTVTTSLGTVGTSGAFGRSVTLVYDTTFLDISVRPDGSAGVATITISTPSVSFAAKTVTFYGSKPATLVASVATPNLKLGSQSDVIRVVAKDAAGVNWAGALYSYASSAADGLIAGSATVPVLCTWNGTDGRHECAVTGNAAGTAKMKVFNYATAALGAAADLVTAGSTVTSNEVSVVVNTKTAATVKISFDKATYAPNERARIYVTPLDSAGLPIAAATFTNIFASGGISTNAGFTFLTPTFADSLTAVSVTTRGTNSSSTGALAGAAMYTVFMPAAGGTVTLTATGGGALPAAGQVAVTATATVTDSGAAALAAVNALATTVASLKTLITTLTNLVLKIQKKVKA